MSQTHRLSTKARDAVEALVDLLTHIAHDGVFTDAEWAACDHQARAALSLVEQTDDAQAFGMAAMKGGLTRNVRELARQYDETHGTRQMPPAVLHIQQRRRPGMDNGAA